MLESFYLKSVEWQWELAGFLKSPTNNCAKCLNDAKYTLICKEKTTKNFAEFYKLKNR